MNKKRILMRKISLGTSVGIFLGILFFTGPSYLLSDSLKLPVSVSLSFGYFQPKEEAFKDLYGNNKFQLNFSMRYVLKNNLSIYSGLRYNIPSFEIIGNGISFLSYTFTPPAHVISSL